MSLSTFAVASLHSFVETSTTKEAFWHLEVEASIALAVAVREALCSWTKEENNVVRVASE